MIKKILYLILCFGLFTQNSIFTVSVFAKENKMPSIVIDGLYQDNNKLNKENDIYVATEYSDIYLKFKIDNYNESTDNYYIRIENKSGSSSGNYYYGEYNQKLSVSLDKPTSEYTIKVCNNWKCDELYTSESFKLNLKHYEEIKNSKVYITNVMQGGKIIEPSESGQFNVNNRENITFTIKGDNLINNIEYSIYEGNNNIKLLGKELQNGIDYTYYTNLGNNSFYLGCYLKDFYQKIYYYDGEKYLDYYFNFIDSEDTTSYNSKLIYTNYQDKNIELSDNDYHNYYIVDSKYHNFNNSLSYHIDGKNYDDKDYTINVDVKKQNEIIYTKQVNVNGLLLNDGYNLELDQLTLELNKEIEIDKKVTYDVYLTINSVASHMQLLYNSVGKDIKLDSEIFFENGIKNLSAFRGFGNELFTAGIYDTNNSVFNKYSSIYINYLGTGFEDNQEYDYILEYGYFTDGQYSNIDYEEEIQKGKIKGQMLNNVGLFVEVKNPKKYNNPTYRLTIKKDDEILFSNSPIIHLVSSPTLANAKLSSNNKNLYLKTSDYSYIATRNMPIDIVISGIGFEEEKTYPFDFCYSKNDGSDNNNQICEKIEIKGNELNNGIASIHFEKEISEDTIDYSFYVICNINEANNSRVAIQGGFKVTFVSTSELLSNTQKYIIDDASDLIKNIKKNTTINDFLDGIEIINNGYLKVYDKNGENESMGNVGTGMIGRIVDEYDRNILDIDIVVTGDINGDGNISVTDLAKIERHIAKLDELDGIYKVAGDINNTDTITLTDLVKISRDIAKIEEIK